MRNQFHLNGDENRRSLAPIVYVLVIAFILACGLGCYFGLFMGLRLAAVGG